MNDNAIENLPLDRDVTSREGISIDQMTRVRLAFLLGQNNALVAQTQFADAKAGALLAIIGLIATRGPGASLEQAATPDDIAVIALHAAALICCIIVLFPRYAGRPLRAALARKERYSWPALASDMLDEDAYAEFMRGSQVSPLVTSMARSNHAQSRILLRKFAWLRAAFAVAVVDFFFIAARAVHSAT
ncbi:MAG: Pycsar system effector family protein [Pikeienuella sp.]